MHDPHILRYRRWAPPGLAEPLVEPVTEWVPVAEGVTLHLLRYPVPADPAATVIVLHGAGGHGRMLSSVAVLAQHCGAEAVAPDLPLYGHTWVTDRGAVRYHHWIDAVSELVRRQRLSGRNVVLFGASMGGRLALDVAHRLGPGVIDAVVATCLLDPRRADARAVVARHPLLLRLGLPMMRVGALLTDRRRLPIRWIAPISRIANDVELARTCARDPLGAGSTVPLGFLRSWLDFDPGYQPDTFAACPVVLAHPGADRWTPLEVSAAFLQELAVPTELVVLEGCGHFPVEPDAARGLRLALDVALGAAGR